MRTRDALALSIAAVALVTGPRAGRAQTFRASDLLKPGVLTGEGYTIEDSVTLVDNDYRFVLRTPYGRIPAQGIDMLELRLVEMGAIARARQMSDQPQVVMGIMDSFKKTGDGLESLITDPLGTVSDVPRGFGSKLASLTHKSTYKGGGEARRKLAAQLGCDPETRNPVLKKLLEELVIRRGIGEGLTSVATIGLTGGAAIAARGAGVLQTTAEMQDALRTTPLYQINEGIRSDLERLGVDAYLAEQFTENDRFTTLQRMQFVRPLKQLAGVQGLGRLVGAAIQIGSEAEALNLIHAVGLLAAVNQSQRIARIVDLGVPAAKLADGRIVAVAAVDYVTARQELQDGIAAFRSNYPNDTAILLTTGRASPEAKKSLADAAIKVIEGADIRQLR